MSDPASSLRLAAAPLPETAPLPEPNTAPDRLLLASWCCSVGATWTVELRSVDSAADHAVPVPVGPVVEWICSGVPTELPVPQAQTAAVLAERDLLWFGEEPAESEPRTRCRRLIGYVTRDPEVLRLALMLADLVDGAVVHPMVLAARWIEARYSADAAVGWVTAGTLWPDVARAVVVNELEPSDSHPPVLRRLAYPTHPGDQS